MADKIWDRYYGLEKPFDSDYAATTFRLSQAPMDRFELPNTSSQEIGWFSKVPVSDNRHDDRVNFPTVHGELSQYMSQYWKVHTDAPAARMSVRRRHVPCHKSARLEPETRSPRKQ